VRPATEIADFLGGFTAAEGTFGRSGTRFRFAICLGAADRGMCELFAAYLGVGHITTSPRRKPHYDDEVTFAIQSLRELVNFVVPFMDEHLPESYKRKQYLSWRANLLDYVENKARKPRRQCTVDGCDLPARAHGLCRRHLWQFRRQ
jgi:hypothetical protein